MEFEKVFLGYSWISLPLYWWGIFLAPAFIFMADLSLLSSFPFLELCFPQFPMLELPKLASQSWNREYLESVHLSSHYHNSVGLKQICSLSSNVPGLSWFTFLWISSRGRGGGHASQPSNVYLPSLLLHRLEGSCIAGAIRGQGRSLWHLSCWPCQSQVPGYYHGREYQGNGPNC